MQEVTIYATAMQAVRRTADDCRRTLALLDAFGVAVSVVLVDSPELRAFVQELLAKQAAIGWRLQHGLGPAPPLQLPLCFVGPVLVGTHDELAELNEAGTLPQSLRAAGYGGSFRAAAHNEISVGNAATPAAAAAAAAPPDAGGGATTTANGSGDDGDGEEEEEPPPPPPPDSEEEAEAEGADSALHSGALDDDDEEPPPPPPPLPEDEEEDEEDAPPPSPPPED
ncbi:uncharacterized protein Tco025E_00355 [Trypanosoma conorhini]|uniref:Uncharacterized protein n=1 Tax=Trypanosoma conorhini TaxID=83891 RepID=A0A422QBX6_9TRYP|nr:uncharacterized protein Tco025E_00355 [Trypanosoma conorhini]RNF27425.1 hypothetical protein Tco025E_00355 [Trypanosoma conorhini]